LCKTHHAEPGKLSEFTVLFQRRVDRVSVAPLGQTSEHGRAESTPEEIAFIEGEQGA